MNRRGFLAACVGFMGAAAVAMLAPAAKIMGIDPSDGFPARTVRYIRSFQTGEHQWVVEFEVTSLPLPVTRSDFHYTFRRKGRDA